MTLDEAIIELRRRNQPVPIPMRLPTPDEVATMQQTLGVQFHPDYVRLLLEASDVVVGPLEPAIITRPQSHTYLPKVVASARHYGVPTELLPICEENADFHCLTQSGEVVFWSHNTGNSGGWPTLAAWLEDVWLMDYD